MRTPCMLLGAVALTLLIASSAVAAGSHLFVVLPFNYVVGSHQIMTQGTARMCGGYPEGCNPNLAVTMGPITSASIGTTIWRDTSSPNFDALAASLTNGVNDPFSIAFNGSGNYGFEQNVIGSQVGPTGVDLSGFLIDRIGVRVDAASFMSPGQNLTGDGIWTDARVQGAFLIEGTCASLPLIAQPAAAKVSVCPIGPAPFLLSAPSYSSRCSASPVLNAAVVQGRARTWLQKTARGYTGTLVPGSYTVEWIADDSFNAASVQQSLTVIGDKRLCKATL